MAFAVACGDDDNGEATTATSSGTSTASPTPQASPTQSATTGECNELDSAVSAGDLMWLPLLPSVQVELGDYTVRDTEGDAPLVDVVQGGQVVGTIELLQFPTTGNVDVTRPLTGALTDWAENFYEAVAVDRQASGGTLTGDNPVDANIGEACGVRYGYIVQDSDDAVIERYAGYVTHDGGFMYLFVALYDAAISEDQGFRSLDALEGFEPEFQELMTDLLFPPDS